MHGSNKASPATGKKLEVGQNAQKPVIQEFNIFLENVSKWIIWIARAAILFKDLVTLKYAPKKTLNLMKSLKIYLKF